MRHRFTGVVVVASLVLVPAAHLHAQTSTPPSTNNTVVADALRQAAIALYPSRDRAYEAAQLHELSALRLSRTDPRTIDALVDAAHLYGYASRPMQARRTMERAAKRALELRDYHKAAQAYVEAVFYAQESNNAYEVARLGKAALRLAQLDEVAPADRHEIAARVIVKRAT